MPNFIAIVDPDADRRRRFIERVTPLLAPVGGLISGSRSSPPFDIAWVAGESAPVSVAEDGAAVLFGTAIPAERDEPLSASELASVWSRPDSPPASFDGYHAAITYDAHRGLLAGADILGQFPLYYYARNGVLLVGSSPELFSHHPEFRTAFDPIGLAGVLLTNGLFERHTLWQGVSRLAPGHVLVARPGEAPREILQYALPVSKAHFDRPFAEHLALTEDAVERAVRRHVPFGPRPVLSLSGGLDSRVLAGFLRRLGIAPLAVTSGNPGDIEMQCAMRVARELGFEHRIEDSDDSRRVFAAETRATWEHLASGFSGTGSWGGLDALRALGTRVVSGHSMDWIVGGYEPDAPDLTFEVFFENINRWGLRPPVLERLLRREVFGDAVPEILAALGAHYHACSDLNYQRAIAFSLHHRQRYHIGATHWATSFAAWPIVPAVDKGILSVTLGVPVDTLRHRKLEIELLCRRFPELAALPLDRNSYNRDPLQPGFLWKARRSVRRRVMRVVRRVVPERPRRVERRYYYRRFDFNAPVWAAIRRTVEPYRSLGREYFHPEVLDALLPPPDVPLRVDDAITGSAGIKTVLGFLLWLGRHRA